MRILLADDSGDQREILVRLLRRWGHDAFAAGDGLEAWALLQRERIDLILTDWVMPGLDGLALCRRIAARRWERRPYIVLLTGRDREADLLTALEAGADEVLTKPFRFERLRACLQAAQRTLAQQAPGPGTAPGTAPGADAALPATSGAGDPAATGADAPPAWHWPQPGEPSSESPRVPTGLRGGHDGDEP